MYFMVLLRENIEAKNSVKLKRLIGWGPAPKPPAKMRGFK
jgi:hypothetical protein